MRREGGGCCKFRRWYRRVTCVALCQRSLGIVKQEGKKGEKKRDGGVKNPFPKKFYSSKVKKEGDSYG